MKYPNTPKQHADYYSKRLNYGASLTLKYDENSNIIGML